MSCSSYDFLLGLVSCLFVLSFNPLSGFGSTANFQDFNQFFFLSEDLSVFNELRNWSVFFFFVSMIISISGRRVCLLAPLPVHPPAPDPSGIFPLLVVSRYHHSADLLNCLCLLSSWSFFPTFLVASSFVFRSSGSGSRFLGSYFEPEIPFQSLFRDFCKMFVFLLACFLRHCGSSGFDSDFVNVQSRWR